MDQDHRTAHILAAKSCRLRMIVLTPNSCTVVNSSFFNPMPSLSAFSKSSLLHTPFEISHARCWPPLRSGQWDCTLQPLALLGLCARTCHPYIRKSPCQTFGQDSFRQTVRFTLGWGRMTFLSRECISTVALCITSRPL